MSELQISSQHPCGGSNNQTQIFIRAVGRCVKFIVPINVIQIGVHKQTVRFVNEYLFIHIHYIHIHVKNYIFNDKTFYFNI